MKLFVVMMLLSQCVFANEGDALSDLLSSEVKGEKIAIEMKDQQSCEGLLKKAREQKMKVLGGASVGAITGYFAAQAKVKEAVMALDVQQNQLASLKTVTSENLHKYIVMKDAVGDGAEQALSKKNALAARESLKMFNVNLKQFVASYDKVQLHPDMSEVLDQRNNLRPQAEALQKEVEALLGKLNSGSPDAHLSAEQMKQVSNLKNKMAGFLSKAKPFVLMKERSLISVAKKATAGMAKNKQLALELARKPKFVAALAGIGGGILVKLLSVPVDIGLTSQEVADGTLSAKYVTDQAVFNEDIPTKEVCTYAMQPGYDEKFKEKLSNVFTVSKQEAAEEKKEASSRGDVPLDTPKSQLGTK